VLLLKPGDFGEKSLLCIFKFVIIDFTLLLANQFEASSVQSSNVIKIFVITGRDSIKRVMWIILVQGKV
jgi:hypothetical protein